MIVNFINTATFNRCKVLLAMDRTNYQKAATSKAKGSHAYVYLVHEGLLETLYPYRPLNEYNSYRLTEKGYTMQQTLKNIGGRI